MDRRAAFLLVLGLSGAIGADRLDKLFEAGSYARSSSVELSTGPSPAIQIDYLTIRGLAELPVLILEATETPYTARFFSKEDFSKVKAKYPLGRLPVLAVAGDGSDQSKLFISQSSSITRYLAERCNLYGMDTPTRRARVDFLYETVQELMKAVDPAALANKTATSRRLHYRETTNRAYYSAYEKASTALLTFEEILGASGGRFLLGDGLSYADLALYLQLNELSEADKFPKWHTVVGTPKLAAFVAAVEALAPIAAYLRSDRRMPRYEPRTVAFVTDYVYKADRFSSTDQRSKAASSLGQSTAAGPKGTGGKSAAGGKGAKGAATASWPLRSLVPILAAGVIVRACRQGRL